ncbi:hypothetical protein ZIOFF_044441 [Zingiber officinale]|uniref:Uncharacterized protein n=1 Tax=Zingiber officinale TaxID=94328 RepID=A0A8J5G5C1_ZINOF|nr:hypothetical protein ZIOFF_044441 [Zingiber officinale]
MDLCCGIISSPKFPIYGSGFADESSSVSDKFHLFCWFSYFVSHHISWPLVYGSCFSCGKKTTRITAHHPELYMQVISIACCVFYSHCGNIAIVTEKHLDRKSSSWFSLLLWKKQDTNSWISKFIRMNEFKDQICSTWFAPVGTASDYPLFSKWVIYGELACNGSCPGLSDEISPIFSLWATFMGLYMAHYVMEVERSTGWALTHTSPLSEYEKLKKQMKPDFLEMVPWYSGTSADLFKTVFDLMVSVTL